MISAERTALTYRLERWRAVTHGVLETAGSTFLLLIAVRWFEAGAISKAMIASGTSVGLLASLLVVTWVSRRRLTPGVAAGRLLTFGAGAFLLGAFVPLLPVFVLASVVGMATLASAIPLLTQMYQENYPAEQRGVLFSRTVVIRILTAAVFAKLAGGFLAVRMPQFAWLLVVFAAAAFVAGRLIRACPTSPLADTGGTHPLRALRYVREDPVFRQTLIAWMLMGTANLMMLPLRVEYLAHERYGLQLSADKIALYTSVIPNLARLVMSPIWGWLFDRMNFFGLRIILNFGFMFGILSFFVADSATGLIAGAIIYGVSNAGGDVAWSLWVTKFAPADRVADYMSVHTFLTGVRGVIAPLLAFSLAGVVSLPTLGWISAAMILAASVVLLPEITHGRRARAAKPLLDEGIE